MKEAKETRKIISKILVALDIEHSLSNSLTMAEKEMNDSLKMVRCVNLSIFKRCIESMGAKSLYIDT